MLLFQGSMQVDTLFHTPPSTACGPDCVRSWRGQQSIDLALSEMHLPNDNLDSEHTHNPESHAPWRLTGFAGKLWEIFRRSKSTDASSKGEKLHTSRTSLPYLDEHDSTRYATLETHCPWFPDLDPTKSTFKIWRSCRGVVLRGCSILAGLVFVINLTLTVTFPRRYHPANGTGELFQGDCDKVRSYNS